MSDQPKICRYCGRAILWGLKPNGGVGDHRPLDAKTARSTYMVLNGAVYFGTGYDVHDCTEEDIIAWNLKKELRKRSIPTTELQPYKPKKPNLPRVEPVIVLVDETFSAQLEAYQACIQQVEWADYMDIADAEMVGWSTKTTDQAKHNSYRQRRDADTWMHALLVRCPGCKQPPGMLCVSRNKYQMNLNIQLKKPHPSRISLANSTYGKKEYK